MTNLLARGAGWASTHLTRRRFIAGAAAAAAAGAGTAVAIDKLKVTPNSEHGLVPLSMAMHVHASASEGSGSMLAQLVQAANSHIDVLWWTDHDQRMAAHAAPTSITFSGLVETPPAAAPFTWSPSTNGSVVHANHVFCTKASHPQLGDRSTALLTSVQARGDKVCTHELSGQAENLLNRTSLAGLTITVDVLPVSDSPMTHASIEIVTSYRPKYGGQPQGQYTVSYRVGGMTLPGVSRLVGDLGNYALIERAAPPGKWTTLTLTPDLDLTRLWPGVDGRDASLFEFTLSASARGRQTADVYFASLRFHRSDISGNTPLDLQDELIRRYAPSFPTVRQIQALEVSLTTPHLGWYGGKVTIPDHTGMAPLPSTDPKVAAKAVQAIHDSGGLASYCHPFGTSASAVPAHEQEKARVAKSAELIANRALGCDLIEVGYRLRGGCNLAQHESVWDNCSRNLILLTGIGVNDDHAGQNWVHEKLNFVTWAWAQSTAEDDLLAALRRGRVYFGDLARFNGTLDIRIDGRTAMGCVSISDAKQQTLSILAAGLPRDGSVDVIRADVDFAGPMNTNPRLERARLPVSTFGPHGERSIPVDTTKPRFVRLVVNDGTGLPIGFSNPVWLLREEPKMPVPSYRRLEPRT